MGAGSLVTPGVGAGLAADEAGCLTVGELVSRLFERWPREWAEAWDRVGLAVGDPASKVAGVACALDVTPDAIRSARERGANVLLTHHPVCLEMPASISPQSSGAETPSSSIWEAVASGVALVAMHTNLDRSPEASLRLPTLLGMTAQAGIEGDRGARDGSLGAIARLEESVTAGEVAALCHERLGREVRLYGGAGLSVRSVAFYSGSMGSEGCDDVRRSGAQLAVCGEVGYHRALDLVSGGRAVVVLGHDVSELPHVDCLVRAAVDCGVSTGSVVRLDETVRWRQL